MWNHFFLYVIVSLGEYENIHGSHFLFFFLKVVEAMRQTVTNMIGTLPPQFFAVTVTTVRYHVVFWDSDSWRCFFVKCWLPCIAITLVVCNLVENAG